MGDTNHGLKPIEPLSNSEVRLAAHFMEIASENAVTPDGKPTDWQLPACIAIAIARYVNQSYSELRTQLNSRIESDNAQHR